MDKIFREGNLDGRVIGIQAHYSPTILPGETEPLAPLSPWTEGNIDSTQETVNVKANKAVVIATGGSSGNVYFRTMVDPRRAVEYDCTSGDPFCPKDAWARSRPWPSAPAWAASPTRWSTTRCSRRRP